MASATVTDVHTFRIPFWRMYLPVAVYAQVLYLPGMWVIFYLQAVIYPQPWPTAFHFQASVAGSVGVVAVLAPAFWLYVRRSVVRVSADGFTCSNGFGRLRTVKWGDITAVRSLHIPGFPYLLVTTTQTRLKLWLPLFLGRLDEFTEQVGRFAGPDHILYQALWPRVEQK